MSARARPAPKRVRVKRRRGTTARFIVLTGLSGSGKSQASHALEDLGYFCIDNLPTAMMPIFAELAQRERLSRVAIVSDVREREFGVHFPPVLRRLRAMPGLAPAVIFLEATNAALVRRFSETRRPHPLAPNRSVVEGIREERVRLATVRRLADAILDTSDMTVHDLRQAFRSFGTGLRKEAPLVATIVSFGYKFGVPLDADLVFDVRFLPNPHFVPALRARTGRDQVVVRFMRRSPSTRELLRRLVGFLKFVLPHYVTEGKSYLTVAVGCTGGRHRSVMVADALRKEIGRVPGVRLRVMHRDVLKET